VTDSRRTQPRKKRTKAASVPPGVRLIAAYKLFKGLVLFALGVGAANMLHKDMAFEVARWADIFRIDPNNHYFHRLLERFSLFNARKLKELSVGTFFYSAMLLTEGTGLLLGKRWAQYFTVIATSSFIPLEIYELTHRVDIARVIILLLNIAIVVYLVVELYRESQSR